MIHVRLASHRRAPFNYPSHYLSIIDTKTINNLDNDSDFEQFAFPRANSAYQLIR